jgi:molybdopterin converting factor small subunit
MAVTVRHGVNSTSSDSVAGKTVAEVREQLEEVLNIPESAQVRVNGSPAGEDNEIADGSTVEFVKVAGEKGCFARP